MSGFDLLGSLGGGLPSSPGILADGSVARNPDGGPQHPQCSRKGCREDATWELLWNNPKIHTPERRKSWLACDEHRAWLTDYLETRGFFRESTPFSKNTPED